MDKVNLLIFICTLPLNLLFAYWYSKSYSINPSSWKSLILFSNLLFLGICLPLAFFALLPQNFGSRPDAKMMIIWLVFSLISDAMIIRRKHSAQLSSNQHYPESQGPKREPSKKEVLILLFIGALILISLIAVIAFNIYLKFYHPEYYQSKPVSNQIFNLILPLPIMLLVVWWMIKHAIPRLKK
jgi:hypothetical protein